MLARSLEVCEQHSALHAGLVRTFLTAACTVHFRSANPSSTMVLSRRCCRDVLGGWVAGWLPLTVRIPCSSVRRFACAGVRRESSNLEPPPLRRRAGR